MVYSKWRCFLCALLTLSFLASPLAAQPLSFAPLVKSERSKVVHISTTSEGKGSLGPKFSPFGRGLPKKHKEQALGSGFILSSDGLILTNNHVIAKADTIEVTLFNEKTYQAEVIGTDPRTDLGLLKIKATGLPYITFGDSDKLDVGDWVIAIGNPLGLDNSVSAGILSARGRDIFSGTAYGQFLQTDAAINPGNSGGPLFNVEGKVIGINTAIVSGGQGLGFAVPSNLAKKIVAQLRDHGSVERGWLGIGIQGLDPKLAASFGLPEGEIGVAVTAVQPNSPAQKAGLLQGDVILAVNGKLTSKVTSLQQIIAESKPNRVVKLTLFRKGKKRELPVKLGKNPTQKSASKSTPEGSHKDLDLVSVTPKIVTQFGLSVQSGVFVRQIEAESSAFEAGLRRGDVILGVNQKPVRQPGEVYRELKKGKKKLTLLLVTRGERQLFIGVPKE